MPRREEEIRAACRKGSQAALEALEALEALGARGPTAPSSEAELGSLRPSSENRPESVVALGLVATPWANPAMIAHAIIQSATSSRSEHARSFAATGNCRHKQSNICTASTKHQCVQRIRSRLRQQEELIKNFAQLHWISAPRISPRELGASSAQPRHTDIRATREHGTAASRKREFWQLGSTTKLRPHSIRELGTAASQHGSTSNPRWHSYITAWQHHVAYFASSFGGTAASHRSARVEVGLWTSTKCLVSLSLRRSS